MSLSSIKQYQQLIKDSQQKQGNNFGCLQQELQQKAEEVSVFTSSCETIVGIPSQSELAGGPGNTAVESAVGTDGSEHKAVKPESTVLYWKQSSQTKWKARWCRCHGRWEKPEGPVWTTWGQASPNQQLCGPVFYYHVEGHLNCRVPVFLLGVGGGTSDIWQ